MIWALVGRFVVDPKLVPPPWEVARVASGMLVSGELGTHVAASVGRVAVGYCLGVVAGVLTGLVLGGSRAVETVLGPLFEFLKGLPPIALVPLSIMWFGIGELPKQLIVAYIVWVVVSVNTAVGVHEVPLVRLRTGRVMGLTTPETFLRVILPSTAPYVLVGMRSAVGFAYIAVVSAELVAANRGLGFVIMDSRFSLETPRMFVGLICLGLVGALSQLAFDALMSRTPFLARYRRR
jgi:ABC-type nitrate/sulfonate/bicarbonate transport system permease component